ncbi:hypothetical protein Clacol_009719 [Clathrus columnatus]|uniref:Uncharacterized protein n=1 Tax=Clathrus columnatus TaxID=1419009 RepID=A0AAV5ASX5_9AGAM|nr:hypothetical protein Clacol_009719 [Clathrus columnatus]
MFLATLGIQLYAPFGISLISNILIALSDVLAFIIVWGLWKLKLSAGIQNNKDIVTLLLQQGTLRFSFVLVITAAAIILSQVGFPGSVFFGFQNVLSTLLLCKFTIAVRQRNSENRGFDQSSLPTPSFQQNPGFRSTPLSRLQESIISEMGERNQLDQVDNPHSEERDSL